MSFAEFQKRVNPLVHAHKLRTTTLGISDFRIWRWHGDLLVHVKRFYSDGFDDYLEATNWWHPEGDWMGTGHMSMNEIVPLTQGYLNSNPKMKNAYEEYVKNYVIR